MGDVEEVGRAIRAARKEARLTQKDLAGISERTVRAIETGTGNPALTAAAGVLGLRLVAEP